MEIRLSVVQVSKGCWYGRMGSRKKEEQIKQARKMLCGVKERLVKEATKAVLFKKFSFPLQEKAKSCLLLFAVVFGICIFPIHLFLSSG